VVFQKRQIAFDDSIDYAVLKPGDEFEKIMSDEKLNYFAIPLVEWSTNSIDLPYEQSFHISVNLIPFQFQAYEFYVDIPPDQTVSAIEHEISRILYQEIEIDHTNIAVTPDTVLPRSELIIPLIPLDSPVDLVISRVVDQQGDWLTMTVVIKRLEWD
jgi:hypothetical protein